ncbi:MAG: D-aminoacylase, partial [Spirochaetales bacterium]
AYGMFPHYLVEFVKRRRILSLEEAVRKLTGLPAHEVFHIKDRGLLQQDMYADIVIMNFDELHAKNDFLNPELPPEGIKFVIINGKISYENKKHTRVKSGKVLRR